MKVEGPSKTTGAKGVSKSGAKKSTGDSAFGSMVEETEEAEAQAPVSRTASIGALDALLTLQSAESGTSEEAIKRAKKRAKDLLDQLDKIKIGMLTGDLSASALQQLSNMLSVHRDQIMDPKLTSILDEVDLRAQIELAKLGR